jgi:hypothetical protein
MMGIHIDSPTSKLCSNISWITISTLPESRLKKKHNSTALYKVREAVAAAIMRIAHVR